MSDNLISDFLPKADLGAGPFVAIVSVILLILMGAAWYIVTAFKWQFIGRKSGLEKDWMPFVPFARTVYKLSIVDEEWWKMFFLDGWWIYSFLLRTLINAISNNNWNSFATILITLYMLCCLAYNIYWRYKFYMAHNIKPHLALTVLVPPLFVVRLVWDHTIAFGRNYPFTGEGTSRALMDVVNVPQHRDASGNPVALTRAMAPSDRGAPWANSKEPIQPSAAQAKNSASITGLSGMYAGQTLPLAENDEMVIGRDIASCNLIIDKNAEKVSRKHCGITYLPTTDSYQVIDYSTNGTFIDGDSRLVSNMPTTLQRGTVIALGNRENRFKLN